MPWIIHNTMHLIYHILKEISYTNMLIEQWELLDIGFIFWVFFEVFRSANILLLFYYKNYIFDFPQNDLTPTTLCHIIFIIFITTLYLYYVTSVYHQVRVQKEIMCNYAFEFLCGTTRILNVTALIVLWMLPVI